jgi:hypothetical protein
MRLTATSALACLLLLVLSASPGARANTLFEALVPNSCVTPFLQMAGFCVLQHNCAERCFSQNTGTGPAPTQAPVDANTASILNLDSNGLSNFYVPVDAIDCDQFEDPICPATKCCPACKDELNELYKCIILEGAHHYIDPLAMTCTLDCTGSSNGIGTPNPINNGPEVETPIVVPGPVIVIDSNMMDIDSNMTDIDSNMTDDFMGDNEDEVTTEFDVVVNNLEKDVIVIVSTPDSVTLVDNHHNNTNVLTTTP